MLAQVITEESRKFDRTGKTQHKRKFKQDLEQYKEAGYQASIKERFQINILYKSELIHKVFIYLD